MAEVQIQLGKQFGSEDWRNSESKRPAPLPETKWREIDRSAAAAGASAVGAALDELALEPLEKMLADRKLAHGDFTDHARITQNLKGMMADAGHSNWNKLSATQREALEMIAHKIGRILAGNPDHRDHWDDIAGYATIAAQRLGA